MCPSISVVIQLLHITLISDVESFLFLPFTFLASFSLLKTLITTSHLLSSCFQFGNGFCSVQHHWFTYKYREGSLLMIADVLLRTSTPFSKLKASFSAFCYNEKKKKAKEFSFMCWIASSLEKDFFQFFFFFKVLFKHRNSITADQNRHNPWQHSVTLFPQVLMA